MSILNKSIAENIPIYFIARESLDRLDSIQIPDRDKEIIESLLTHFPQ